MIALPAGPAPAPRRQLLVGTALACAAGATLYGGMLALYLRFRQRTLGQPEGVWRPEANIVPEVATNNMLISFVAIFVFAQWAVYAARRDHRAYTGLALGLTALIALAVINAQAFVYDRMAVALRESTFGTFFYVLTGTFLVLMVAGVVFTLVTAFRYLGGRTHDREILAAHALYWYFVGVVFAALWFVVYVTK